MQYYCSSPVNWLGGGSGDWYPHNHLFNIHNNLYMFNVYMVNINNVNIRYTLI